MNIVPCVQGTEEWFAARCGVPSSSNFDKIITTKGEPSKQRTKYLWQLAGERIVGKPEESFQSAAMARGNEMQNEAKNLYQVINDVVVEEVGFCLFDSVVKIGSSPDGLVGPDGGLEIKCPNLATHVGYLLDNCLPTDYFQQTQGELLVTGRQWFDFLSYYPGLKPLIIRVYRDDDFLKSLERELRLFCLELEEVVKKIQ